jgi:hypothetical protein
LTIQSGATRRTSGFWTAKVPNAEIFQYLPCKTLMCQVFGRIIELPESPAYYQKIN